MRSVWTSQKEDRVTVAQDCVEKENLLKTVITDDERWIKVYDS